MLSARPTKNPRIRKPSDRFTKLPHGQIRETLSWEFFSDNLPILVTKKLLFTLKNGTFLALHSLMPKRAKLINPRYNSFRLSQKNEPFCVQVICDRKNKTHLFLHYGDLTLPGGFISLLHEIGHLKTATLDQLDELEELKDFLEDDSIPIANQKLFKAKEGKIFIQWRPIGPLCQLPFDDWFYFHSLRSALERRAWAWALKIVRKCRRKGINLEPTFKTATDFRKYIHQQPDIALGGYEYDFQKQQLSCQVTGLYSKIPIKKLPVKSA